jgi:hypothetical protein
MNRVSDPALNRVLQGIGLRSLSDLVTIAPEDCFEKLDEKLVLDVAAEHKLTLGLMTPRPLDAESKLEIINRVLSLKYEMIIDSVKDIDGGDHSKTDTYPEEAARGYRLEHLPSGF